MAFTYTVGQLKTDLSNSLHGTTLNKVQGVNQLIQRAGSQLLLELDPMETKRIVQLTNPIYNQVYDYLVPEDLKGTKIIDIRPQANRTLLDRYVQQYGQDFDINKFYTLNPNFEIQFNQGVKTIRIDNNLLVQGVSINEADTISGNGLWIAGEAAINLRQDNLQFVNGASSSLEFDTDTSDSFYSLTNSTMNPLDLTEQLGQGVVFFWTYLPTGYPANADIPKIALYLGSSSNDYYYSPAFKWDGTSLVTGWNLMAVNWSDLIQNITGTPNITKISFIRIEWQVISSTDYFGFRLNSIFSRLGVISEMVYYSKYLYQDALTGAFQETITDDSNIINLDTETRNLIYLLTGVYTVQQVQGLDALFFDSNYFQQKYDETIQAYKAQYKSEWQKPRTTYYGLPNPSNQKWMNGNRFNY